METGARCGRVENRQEHTSIGTYCTNRHSRIGSIKNHGQAKGVGSDDSDPLTARVRKTALSRLSASIEHTMTLLCVCAQPCIRATQIAVRREGHCGRLWVSFIQPSPAAVLRDPMTATTATQTRIGDVSDTDSDLYNCSNIDLDESKLRDTSARISCQPHRLG